VETIPPGGDCSTCEGALAAAAAALGFSPDRSLFYAFIFFINILLLILQYESKLSMK